MAKTNRICSVEGCGNRHYSRGWCRKHYSRWQRNNDPLAGIAERNARINFLIEVAVPYGGKDCLIFPFGKSGTGYGQAVLNGSVDGAHRIVCRLAHGEPESEKLVAAHTCGNGHLGCVNPGHLRWATYLENYNDAKDHGKAPAGEAHGCSKLTSKDVQEILDHPTFHGSGAVLAEKYGVSRTTISRIVNRQNWRGERGMDRSKPPKMGGKD